MALQASQQQNFRIRAKIPSLLCICTFFLAALALMSIFSSPLLDLDHFPRRSRTRRRSLPSMDTPNDLERILTNLSHVPSKGNTLPHDIWNSRYSDSFYGCSNPSFQFPSAPKDKSNGYLIIAASGGLNQQRTGITDAVVVAWILNATLVIPELDHNSFWKDPSNFTDIFDADWFISSLMSYITVVKELPEDAKDMVPYTMRVPRKSTPEFYIAKVLPILQRRHVVKLTKFDYRLANNLEDDLQKLRCKVNYHALRFKKDISITGQVLVYRMRMKSRRFAAIHLRFEADMLAFSGCYYGGGDKERKELGHIRQRWKTLPEANPERERRHGKCPLTPEEVGLMLRALGFDNNTYVYVASGEVYGGEATLRPLKYLFPNFYTKETLLSKTEIEHFSHFSSQMAALDYVVCDQSDVFVTNNNGNMARILAGHRRYLGHKRTIRPNAGKLSSLLPNWRHMGWDIFEKKVRVSQKGFMGEPDEMRPGRGEFHEYPYACICEKQNAKETMREADFKGTAKRQEYENDMKENDDFLGVDPVDIDWHVDQAENTNFEETSSMRNYDREIEELLSD